MKMRWKRREFLAVAPALLAGRHLVEAEATDGRPTGAHPQATSWEVTGPKWESLMTVTVGQSKGDIMGADHKAIQAAVDYVAGWGGGTVRILPGTYQFRNAVFLRSGVRVVGSGLETVLIKTPMAESRLAEDSDFYQDEITLADPDAFQVGDGVCLRARSLRHGAGNVFTRTIVARNGNRFKLDRRLNPYEDLWVKADAKATRLHSLFSCLEISQAQIENLTLDGNKANNEFLNGNHVACVFMMGCNRTTVRGVTARNFNGDGMSWGIAHDVVVENCRCHDNEGFGLHPGAGAQRPLARGNRLERNDIGFFFCWGAKHGLVEDNVILDSRRFGISAGHQDTDNLIRHNEIRGSGEAGVLFRKEESRFHQPNRNRLENNRILDSGPADGVGVDVHGETEAITLAHNEIRETRQPMKRIGVRIGAETREVRLVENRIEGFAVAVSDLRQRAR